MKITRIWFDADYIYGVDDSGKEYRQSLLWYPNLHKANDIDRLNYKFGFRGIHWRELDEDISFDSFADDDAEPTLLQRFFLTHKEIKISEFAKRIGIDATLLITTDASLWVHLLFYDTRVQKKLIVSRQPIQLTLNLYHEKHVAKVAHYCDPCKYFSNKLHDVSTF